MVTWGELATGANWHLAVSEVTVNWVKQVTLKHDGTDGTDRTRNYFEEDNHMATRVACTVIDVHAIGTANLLIAAIAASRKKINECKYQ